MKRRHVLVGALAGMVAGSRVRHAAAASGRHESIDNTNATEISGGRTFSKKVFFDNQSIYELVPDRLFRIGCTVEAKRLSWLHENLDAYEPLNCYLFVDDEMAFSSTREQPSPSLPCDWPCRKLWVTRKPT